MTQTTAVPYSPASPTIVRYKLDEPGGQGPFQFSAGEEIVIAGWALLEPAGATAPVLMLEQVDLRTGVVARVQVNRCPRPDVAAHFGLDHALMSGFTSKLRIDDRDRGEHSVRLIGVVGPRVSSSVDLFSFSVAPVRYEASARGELAARFLRGSGVEVGALQRRLEVPGHCAVTYVDRLPLQELLAHYPELRGQPLQKPDLIDDGETLTTLGSGSQDFVIANHFLEHCENPIQTVLNFGRVLKDSGILYMAVPDKRFTFDIDRPITPFATLAETFERGRRSDREDLYREWAIHVNRVPSSDVPVATQKLLAEKYSIHFNVWALADLLEFVSRCRAEFSLPFTLEWVVCSDNEVILILRKESRSTEVGT